MHWFVCECAAAPICLCKICNVDRKTVCTVQIESHRVRVDTLLWRKCTTLAFDQRYQDKYAHAAQHFSHIFFSRVVVVVGREETGSTCFLSYTHERERELEKSAGFGGIHDEFQFVARTPNTAIYWRRIMIWYVSSTRQSGNCEDVIF